MTTPFLDSLDIAGYNYGSGRYPLEAKAHPNRVLFGSETFPQDIWKNWQMVKKYPYLVGDFMWTSWGYLGEAGIGAWSYTGGMPFNRPYPWVLAGAGVIDILGIPDGSCKYTSTVWGLEGNPVIAVKSVNHPGVRPSKSVWRGTNAILSWSWANCLGNKAEVEVYSDQTQAELLINGKSVGRQKVKERKTIFMVKYQPGTVTVDCGELLAFGSADPCTEEQYHTGSFTTYYGRALAVVRAGEAGTVSIKASDGSMTGTAEIAVR